MKYFVLIFLISAVVLLAQTPGQVVEDFVNSLNSYSRLQHQSTIVFSDVSSGDLVYELKAAYRMNQVDTVVGYDVRYESYSTDYYDVITHSIRLYTPDTVFEYSDRYLGKDVVRYYVPENQPGKFFGKVIKYGDREHKSSPFIKSFIFYKESILQLAEDLQEFDEKWNYEIISDTIIDDKSYTQLFCTYLPKDSWSAGAYELYIFDKKTMLPVYYYKNWIEQSYKVDFRDYRFNEHVSDTLFTRNAFPPNCRFIENAESLKKEKLDSGAVAPKWTLKTIEDQTYSLDDFNDKLTLLTITELRCAPCMWSIPHLIEITDSVADINVIAIYPLDSQEKLKEIVKSRKINYKVFYDAKPIYFDYKASGYPSFFLINKQGIIVDLWAGHCSDYFCKKEILDRIEKAMQKE